MTKVVDEKIDEKSGKLDGKVKEAKEELMDYFKSLSAQIDSNTEKNNQKIENLMEELDQIRNQQNITEKQINNHKLMIESMQTKSENQTRDFRHEFSELENQIKQLVSEDRVNEIISYNLADFKIQSKDEMQK